jgi:tetratricopeptide (TPR) repeat protein
MSDEITKANEEMFDRLLVSIEAGMGLIQIFIAVCDADRQREQIISNYERELAPNVQIYRVYLDRQEPSLRQAVDRANLPKENAIAMILGAEALGLSSPDDESLNKFFGYLQWTREAMRSLKLPLILWVPSRIFNQLAKRTPDFWSWRNGVFQFQPESSLSIVDLPQNIRSDEQPNSVFSAAQLEASLAKAIATWGANSRNVETLYSQLGNLYAQQVRLGTSIDREHEIALAENYLDRAILLSQGDVQKQAALATNLNNLAELYYSIGRYIDAEPLYLKSLTIREQKLGENHLDTATSLNNLAGLYYSIGKYAEAEPLYVRSLAINQQQLGENHPDTATSLNNLAALYRSIGRYTDAELLYLRSININQQQLGVKHPAIATNLNNLAGLYESLGRHAEAKHLYEQAFEIVKKTLGINHPNTQTISNNLQSLCQQLDNSSPQPTFN